jgi:NDP-sugar pyrophosphorylase family protein
LLAQLDSFDCINRVVIAVGYKSDVIINRYADNSAYNFKILFSIENNLLGTGGAIKQTISLTRSDDILVLNGDSYVEVNISDFMATHKSTNAFATVVVKEEENANRYGRIEIDEQKRVLLFEEKANNDKPGFINAGMYLMKRDIFNEVEEGIVLSLEKEILPKLVASGVYGYIASGKFIDIGVPETYKIADNYLKGV